MSREIKIKDIVINYLYYHITSDNKRKILICIKTNLTGSKVLNKLEYLYRIFNVVIPPIMLQLILLFVNGFKTINIRTYKNESS